MWHVIMKRIYILLCVELDHPAIDQVCKTYMCYRIHDKLVNLLVIHVANFLHSNIDIHVWPQAITQGIQ